MCEILASVLDRPLERLQSDEGPALGAAVTALNWTGQPVERIEQDTHRNFWLDAEAAVKYGLVGNIITSAAEIGGRH